MHGNTVAAAPLLEVRDLSVRFVSREATVTAVNGATFSLRTGEVLCLLGESGSGKSVTLRALMRLLPKQAQVAGRVELGGQDVLALEGKALRAFRGGAVSMVFQEPMTALDPVYTIGQHLVEMIRRHKGGTRAEARARAAFYNDGVAALNELIHAAGQQRHAVFLFLNFFGYANNHMFKM